MGTVTITLDAEPTHSTDIERQVTGKIILSNSYANGTGDTFTLGKLGLGILTDLFIVGRIGIYRVSDTLPVIGTGTTVHIKAYGTGAGSGQVFAEISNATALNATTVRFRAFGY